MKFLKNPDDVDGVLFCVAVAIVWFGFWGAY